jgi:signal peptidase I
MEEQPIGTPSSVSTRKSPFWAALVELAQSLILGVLLAAALHIIIQPTIVHGQSMEPSLHENERVIVEKVSYHIGEPSRGDIVIFPVEGEPLPLIKRVIGLPGETVEVRDGHVFVNGVVLREPYASGPTFENIKPMHVPTDTVFVMGDNRTPGGSLDSRRLGPIPTNKIVGRARVAIWPPSNWSILDSQGVK